MSKKKTDSSKKLQLPAVKVSFRTHYLMGIVAAMKNQHLKDSCSEALQEFAVKFLADRGYKPDPSLLAEADAKDLEILED